MGAMLIYAEEALDDEELESGKLKKANVGDVIIGAFKKAKGYHCGTGGGDWIGYGRRRNHAGHGVGRDLHQPVRQG